MIDHGWDIEQVHAMSLEIHGAYRGHVPKQLEWYGLHNMNCVVWLVEEGRGRIECAQGEVELIKGNWCFQMPGLRLNQIFVPGTRLISIRFQLRWANGRSLFSSQQVWTLPEGDAAGLKQAALGLLRFLPTYGFMRRQPEDFTQLDQIWARDAAEQHFLSRWYRCVRECGYEPQLPEISDRRVQQAQDLLRRRLLLRDVPYVELQAALSLSRAQLDRIFQQELGHSPKREHDLLRLAHAQEQLLYSNQSIKQIAAATGFHDASQFTKWFRRLDGRTPRQARTGVPGPI